MKVYFDNAATTRVCPEAAENVAKMMTEDYGNPSSTHTMGRQAREALDTARKAVARALGAAAEEIYFTAGGTEADNWAVFSGAELLHRQGRHIITTLTEHEAVRAPCRALEERGYAVTFLQPDRTGRVSTEDFAAAVREDTILASVMLVNNETGAVNPVSEMSAALRRRCPHALFHTDAVQALCKLPFSPKSLGADMISVSAHKIHGPKGVGALYIRKGLRLPPRLLGGGQEGGIRAGTEALPLIAGFGAAAERGIRELDAAGQSISEIRAYIIGEIARRLPESFVIGGGVPHILSLSLPGYRGEVLMNFLEGQGVCVARSSACKRGRRSHVLEAMRLGDRVIDGAVRVSFSRYSTMEEARYFVDKLCAAAAMLIKV